MIYNGKLIKMTEYIRNTLVFLFRNIVEFSRKSKTKTKPPDG